MCHILLLKNINSIELHVAVISSMPLTTITMCFTELWLVMIEGVSNSNKRQSVMVYISLEQHLLHIRKWAFRNHVSKHWWLSSSILLDWFITNSFCRASQLTMCSMWVQWNIFSPPHATYQKKTFLSEELAYAEYAFYASCKKVFSLKVDRCNDIFTIFALFDFSRIGFLPQD